MSAASARASVSSFATGSGKESVSAISAGGRRGLTEAAPSPLASRHASAPSAPSRSTTAAPGRRADSPRRLTPSSESLPPLGREWEQVERERLEKEVRLAVVDDERPAGRRHGRRRERGEAPGGRPHTSPPLLPIASSARPERLLETPGQALHPRVSK